MSIDASFLLQFFASAASIGIESANTHSNWFLWMIGAGCIGYKHRYKNDLVPYYHNLIKSRSDHAQCIKPNFWAHFIVGPLYLGTGMRHGFCQTIYTCFRNQDDIPRQKNNTRRLNLYRRGVCGRNIPNDPNVVWLSSPFNLT